MFREESNRHGRALFECVDRAARSQRIMLGLVEERRVVRWLPYSVDPIRFESSVGPCRSPGPCWWLGPSIVRGEAAGRVRFRLGIAGKQKLTRRARPRAYSMAQN